MDLRVSPGAVILASLDRQPKHRISAQLAKLDSCIDVFSRIYNLVSFYMRECTITKATRICHAIQYFSHSFFAIAF